MKFIVKPPYILCCVVSKCYSCSEQFEHAAIAVFEQEETVHPAVNLSTVYIRLNGTCT